MISLLRTSASRYTTLYIHSPGYMPLVRLHHRELLDAYRRQDSELAAQRTLTHIQSFGAFMVRELRIMLEDGNQVDVSNRRMPSVAGQGGLS